MGRNSDFTWSGEYLDRVSFPLGGIGAGMIGLEGSGQLASVSIRHQPQVFNEPYWFAAICLKNKKGNIARVLQGPVPKWKTLHPWDSRWNSSGQGGRGGFYGLPHFRGAKFRAHFPFGEVSLSDSALPISVTITGWSPFIPNDADNSSLPVAAMEYEIRNDSSQSIEAVFSFHSRQQMGADDRHVKPAQKDITPERIVRFPTVNPIEGGFRLDAKGFEDKPWAEGHLAIQCDAPNTTSDCAWFRGGWFDGQSLVWRNIESGELFNRPPHASGMPSDGGSLYAPLTLKPGESRRIVLRISWYVPRSSVVAGINPAEIHAPKHEPWYAGRFASLDEVAKYWKDNYASLRNRSQSFADAFMDSTLPPAAVEAMSANLGIIKSPTVLRQKDGRVWGWEGCFDSYGCCHGTCTHVWNYAQSIPRLFSALERGMRETEFEFHQVQDGEHAGHQNFRVALPIAPQPKSGHTAADGQLGGIVKVYREWQINGDESWLRTIWPRVVSSLNYCIKLWDPNHEGVLVKPHHNTYDIEFWGPDGMCGSIYLQALSAAIEMGRIVGHEVSLWQQLREKGKRYLEERLFRNGYFRQEVRRDVDDPHLEQQTPEARELFDKEGPKYQYGDGVLADGVIGEFFAWAAGLPPILDDKKIASHLESTFKHNFRETLHEHANVQRPTYGFADDAGLLMCSWPEGNKLTLPFPYADEVWTGTEYQVAAHLISIGRVKEGLKIVEAIRTRYDGKVRNPFSEFECGHWYARAMSSYALLQALTGFRYSAVTRTLHLNPRVELPMRTFFSTATAFGTLVLTKHDLTITPREGELRVDTLNLAGRAIPAKIIARADRRAKIATSN